MRPTLLVLIVSALVMPSAPLFATPVTFFGQDVNTAGDPSTAIPMNSNAAHNSFFNNLNGTQTQTFESYASGTSLPLTISFGTAGNATLSDPTGGSLIQSGNDGAGRFPVSGTQYLETGAGSGFTLTFSSPVSALAFTGRTSGTSAGCCRLG